MSATVPYEQFLSGKKALVNSAGIAASEFNPLMYEFQKHITEKALSNGRYGVFADCGLGKTIIQEEWARQITEHTKKPVVIAAPLAVSGQTIEEGEKFGYEIRKLTDQKYLNDPGIYITNYEQLQNYSFQNVGGIVLDESSILKNFEGKTKNLLVDVFNNTKYKLCCTATPSPNDYTELGNHAEFLNVCKRTEMLSRYFLHDGGETSKWYLKGHAVDEFWKWVCKWGIMLASPEDIGFDGADYYLPPIEYFEHLIKTPHRAAGKLFNDVSINATNYNQELRATMTQRLNLVKEIVDQSNENFIIWVKQNEEADILKRMLPEAVEVRGNESVEIKEEKLLGFGKNKFRILITKGKIGRYGLNYQNCRNEIFASPDFSFETVYQCIRRVFRYGQTKRVNIHILCTDTMQGVKQIFREKAIQFNLMREQFKKAYDFERLQAA